MLQSYENKSYRDHFDHLFVSIEVDTFLLLECEMKVNKQKEAGSGP